MACILWGSILDLDDQDYIFSDIDMLVLVNDLKPFYLKCKNKNFGVPVSHIKRDSLWFDIFYIDESYLLKALEDGHWTLFRAIKEGIRIIDHDSLVLLDKNLENYKPFTINTPYEWFNQACTLLQKSQDLLDNGEVNHSVVLCRDAVQSALFALIYKEMGRPPSPKTLFYDLNNIHGPNNMIDRFIKIHKINNLSKEEITLIQIQSYEIIEHIKKYMNIDDL